jgi:hypothetical protein
MVKMGTVWDRAAEFLTDNLPAILPIALLAYFVPLTIQGSFAPVIEDASFGLALVLRLISLAFAVLSLWGSLTLAAMVLGGEGDPGTIGMRRLPAALLVWILVLVLFCLLFLPVVGALIAGGTDPASLARGIRPEIPKVIAWPLTLYSVAALGVVMWISARLVVVAPVIIAEKRALGAIARSWKLTRGITWRVIGVTLLYVMVSTVATLAAQTVFGSIFQLVAGPGGGLSLSGVLTSITVAAVQTAFSVIVPAFTAKLYLALTAAERDRAAAP